MDTKAIVDIGTAYALPKSGFSQRLNQLEGRID
jgi:hypothetical protein